MGIPPPPNGSIIPQVPGQGIPPVPGVGVPPVPGQQPAEGGEQPVDDGKTEEERKKEELQDNEDFQKYMKMYKFKIRLVQIKQKMREDGIFDPDLIEVN